MPETQLTIFVTENKSILFTVHLVTAVMGKIRQGEQFFVVNDEDGEPLAVAMNDMNMLIGTETTRYSEALLETVYREIFGANDVPPA